MVCRGCIEAHHPMAITPLVLRLRLSTMSAPPVFTALRPERTLSAPPEPLVPLPTLMVTMPPPARAVSRADLPATTQTERDHGIFNARLSIPMVGLVGVGEGTWVWGSGMQRKVVPLRAPIWGKPGNCRA